MNIFCSQVELKKICGRLSCVPDPIPNCHGRTFISHDELFWELGPWMPGTPMLSATSNRIAAACATLAELHRLWGGGPLHPAPNFLKQRTNFVNRLVSQCGTLHPATHRMLCEEALKLLHPMSAPDSSFMPYAQQMIHGDLHRDHVLFTGDAVTGLIDFSSIKLDHPAVDLARFLGDLDIGNVDALSFGVEAYREAAGNQAVTLNNVQYLDRLITLGAAATWMLRFARDEVPMEKSAAAAARLERIVARLRRQAANGVSAFESFS